MPKYKVYHVESLDSHTNGVIAKFFEQKAVVSECHSLKCADGREHSTWEFSGDDYAILRKSASDAGLCFRTWVELLLGEKPVVFETVEGSTVVSAVAFSKSNATKTASTIRAFRRRIKQHRRQRGLDVRVTLCVQS